MVVQILLIISSANPSLHMLDSLSDRIENSIQNCIVRYDNCMHCHVVTVSHVKEDVGKIKAHKRYEDYYIFSHNFNHGTDRLMTMTLK